MASQTSSKIEVSESIGSVSSLTNIDKKSKSLIILAHGAGAGMHHSFMQKLSEDLLLNHVATLRFQFPYMENRKGRPDTPKNAHETIVKIIDYCRENFDLPMFLGGKSYGGRMSGQVLAKFKPQGIKGIIYYGFPLHAPGRDSTDRGFFLKEIEVPMLFLQGTKDRLANLDLLLPFLKEIPLAKLVILDEADHSFKSPKRSGKTQESNISELAHFSQEFIESIL